MGWRDVPEAAYDPDVARSVLVAWRETERRWVVLKVARSKVERDALVGWGELFFGEPPWSQALLLEVVGRLGSVEAAVAALKPPLPLVLKPLAYRPVAQLPDVSPARESRRRRVVPPVQGRLL